MDAANIDLKAFTEGFYKRLCSAQLQPVLDTLVYLKHETEVWLEVTTLLIPGENDGPGEIAALSAWILANLGPDVPLHFTAFHPDYRMLDKPRTPARDAARGAADRAVARAALRLHRQRARRGDADDLLPRLRGGPDRPRLARDHRVGADRRRAMPGVRRALPRGVRRPARRLGPAPPAARARLGRGLSLSATAAP